MPLCCLITFHLFYPNLPPNQTVFPTQGYVPWVCIPEVHNFFSSVTILDTSIRKRTPYHCYLYMLSLQEDYEEDFDDEEESDQGPNSPLPPVVNEDIDDIMKVSNKWYHIWCTCLCFDSYIIYCIQCMY